MLLRPLAHRAQYLVVSHQSRKPTSEAEQIHREQQISIAEADKVARSLPYCSQDGRKARGINFGGFFAAKQLATVYSDTRCLDKFLWTKEVFVHMADCGYDTGVHGIEMMSNMWPLGVS